MKAKLTRYYQDNKLTLGVFKIKNYRHKPIYTLELPWRDNQTDISCIPAGTYKVVPYNSKKFPNVYQVLDVHGRTLILIHIGNYPSNTDGCILVGLGVVPEKCMITNSGDALREIKLIAKEFELTIEDV